MLLTPRTRVELSQQVGELNSLLADIVAFHAALKLVAPDIHPLMKDADSHARGIWKHGVATVIVVARAEGTRKRLLGESQ